MIQVVEVVDEEMHSKAEKMRNEGAVRPHTHHE